MNPFFSKNEEKFPKLQAVDKVHDDVVCILSIHGHVFSLKTPSRQGQRSQTGPLAQDESAYHQSV
jgi:hypothetical protein